MARIYYRKKEPQTEKCSYCLNIEKQEIKLETELAKDRKLSDIPNAQIQKFIAKDALNLAIQLEPIKRKLEDCKFPNCDGKCSERER